MYVAYFDEVKPNPPQHQHCYLVGGIMLKMRDIAEIETLVTQLSVDTFGSGELIPQTEFHASHIYFAKGAFKGMPVGNRIAVLEKLGAILNHRDKIKLVYACIHTEKLHRGTDAAQQAFMHFVERVDLALEKDEFAILIGDLDDQQARNMVADFSRYRTSGTSSAYGKLIARIVDSVHFCRSHHSRMIQLADIYLFVLSGLYQPRTGYMATKLAQAFAGVDLFPTRYKEWPKGRG